MDRNEKLRSHQVVHQLQLFLAGMPRDVDFGHLFVIDLGAPPVEVVDQVGDGLLVPGNEPGREDHSVPPLQLDLLVVVHGDAGQRAHRLPLGAGGDHADLLLGKMGELFQVDEDPVGDPQVAKLPGDLDVSHHGAAVEQDLAAAGGSGIHHLLDPVDMLEKGGDDDPPTGGNMSASASPTSLREGIPLPLNVG